MTKPTLPTEPKERMKRVLLAADSASVPGVQAWSEAFLPDLGGVKLGYEFFYANGREKAEDLARKVQSAGSKVFLDLKLYDIPNTLVGATHSLAHFPADWITFHLSAGSKAMKQMEDARKQEHARWNWVGVSVLTSFSGAEYSEWQGTKESTTDLISRWIEAGMNAGIGTFVCSASELPVLVSRFPEACWIVPGVRLKDDPSGDQVRVHTPHEALKLGADWLVMGRSLIGREVAQAKRDLLADLS